ncbi:dihydrolipoamide acetyltransferase family protein [Pseudolysinimonas yzui]|uniref:Dihydrolipoamide acetyltransferase component of pyruvate dehydrogenase complex n=1 Tax=Pseudolysinimonas yzui TaxID=2708254 RepID=A0A8J3GPY3_9MICO|nr:dihydrolipoamide acetyltransferase family protein [Pseudolysinimonas yzui]GHF12960.1 dihydrolipoamide acetyltransferase component of pyruvate dehydrogenase complex [Pseudolysinimonas yzui]
MTKIFRLPDLGEGLTEAALIRWLVAPGDTVRVDQPIAEVETAKSVVELPSPYAGTVAALHGAEGDTLQVGSALLEVDPVAVEAVDVEKEAYRQEEQAGSGNVLIGYGTSGHSGGTRRRKPARTPLAASAALPAPTGPVAVRSPIVRRLARAEGLDLHTIPATGADGAVTRGDVLRALSVRQPAPSGEPAGSGELIAGLAVARREPLGMLRKTVGAKLSRSRAEIPEATVWVDVDATDLWTLRAGMAVDGKSPSLTAILARFVLLALDAYPILGGRLSDDGTELIEFAGVNLGVATDTPRGLMVPVVRNAHRLTIAELDAELRRVAESARSGASSPDELTGSTFTLNNYGAFGVDGSAAIINHPEVAILGVGRMLERPWVVDGEIVPRRIVQLSLVFDHRVCDGGYASGFLRMIVDAIEHPAQLYRRL